FIVCVILVRAHNDLAVQRMLDVTLDQHGNGLVHLVGHNLANQRTLERLFCLIVHYLASFWLMTVLTRAMSRRTFFTCAVLFSCWVAICMRRPKWAFSKSFSSLAKAAWS